MRILHLCSYSLYSGPLPPTLGLALAQRDLGHDVHIAFDTKRGAFNNHEEAAEPHVTSSGLALTPALTLSAKSTLGEWLRDRRLLQRVTRNVDVVHCHLSHDHTLAALTRLRAPLVRTLHSPRTLAPRVGQRWLNSRAKGWVVRARPHGSLLKEQVGGQTPIAYIPSGIDHARFIPASLTQRDAARTRFGIDAQSLVVLHAAHMDDNRGHRELIDALASCPRDVHVLFAGAGPDEPELKARADRAGVALRAHFAGYLHQDALLEAYACADVAFCAKPGNDGGARAALEAMACELPVIGVQRDSLSELVTTDVGYPIASGNSAAIATALTHVRDDGSARLEKGHRGRERIESERTFAAEATASVELYESL